MASLRHAGAELHYELLGRDGPALLLIPGLASDAVSWGRIPNGLAATHRVVLLDNRGAGQTRAEGPFSLETLAGDALALMDHLGHARFRVLAHSMGGAVALHLAARTPERVERMVLAGSFLAVSKRNRVLFRDWATVLETSGDPAAWYRNLFIWIFSAAFFELPGALDTATRAALAYPFAPTPAQFRSQIQALEAFRAPEGLASLDIPTLVLAGQEDILVPPADSRALAAALPRSRFQALPGAAHALHLEQPGPFVEAVRTFLATC